MTDRVALRKHMRATRRALSAGDQRRAAIGLAAALSRHRRFRQSMKIGVFFASDGEMDLAPLIRHAWRIGKMCCLPLVRGRRAHTMRFSLYQPNRPLRRNRFGIPEPIPGKVGTIAARDLDLVLVPLVAFDNAGHRVGMGGGFYDRTFAFIHRRRYLRRPYLMGIGYEFQRVTGIEPHPWDVPLHGVCTECGVTES